MSHFITVKYINYSHLVNVSALFYFLPMNHVQQLSKFMFDITNLMLLLLILE